LINDVVAIENRNGFVKKIYLMDINILAQNGLSCVDTDKSNMNFSTASESLK